MTAYAAEMAAASTTLAFRVDTPDFQKTRQKVVQTSQNWQDDVSIGQDIGKTPRTAVLQFIDLELNLLDRWLRLPALLKSVLFRPLAGALLLLHLPDNVRHLDPPLLFS